MKKDVIIIGAGLSGIGAACHLTRDLPNKTYLILESRAEIGGTWSLFKYPGIRSDSDIHTFGYSFKPWKGKRIFAQGDEILNYLNEAIEEYDVRKNIVFNKKVISANFNSSKATWTIKTKDNISGETANYEANLLFSCSGYYQYDKGYTPDFKGIKDFVKPVVHPQLWNNEIDYSNKEIVVIGSGATAITLVPSLAKTAKKVTMLQRSPSYIGAMPSVDAFGEWLKKVLPEKLAYKLVRFKSISYQLLFYYACKAFPNLVKKFIVNQVEKGLRNSFPTSPHFVPNYNPWDQRFCLAPDGDFYKSIISGEADVVTDTIKQFTKDSIELASGKVLKPDIVITATGLNLLAFGGINLAIDDEKLNLPDHHVYKGLMLNEVPNAFFFVGYSNSSWTLKSDLTSKYASRIIKYMDKNSKRTVVARKLTESISEASIIDLNSGYIKRSEHIFPKQGDKVPWKVYQNFFLDYLSLEVKGLENPNLKFS